MCHEVFTGTIYNERCLVNPRLINHHAVRIPLSRSRNGDVALPRRHVPLSSHNLVIMRTEVHAQLSPGVEMRCHIDGSALALARADGPVLLEGSGAGDGRLVGSGSLEDLVGGAVGGDGALLRGGGGGVVVAEGLDDIVLD